MENFVKIPKKNFLCTTYVVYYTTFVGQNYHICGILYHICGILYHKREFPEIPILFTACIWHYNAWEVTWNLSGPFEHPKVSTLFKEWQCRWSEPVDLQKKCIMHTFVWVQLIKCQSSKNFLFFPKCTSIRNLFKTYSLSEPQP